MLRQCCVDMSQFPVQTAINKIAVLQQGVLAFWDEQGRRDLPWRLTRDPWETLLAEMLLRKTTATQVIGVFNQLSGLSAQEIAQMETGTLEMSLHQIGMSEVRARDLRVAADSVAKKGAGILESPGVLRSLPGVGRYIESAVMCFAFGARKPALDTNMIRVLQRFFGVESCRSRAREDDRLWEFAESILPRERCREFNYGVIDFATALCTKRNPRHEGCPLRNECCFFEGVRDDI